MVRRAGRGRLQGRAGLAMAAVASAGEAIALPRSAEAQQRPPHEAPSDPPPAPDAIAHATSPAPAIRRGAFESVQVNVDAAGLNVVGDAANEPTIAVSRLDRRKIAIGWRQFDSIASDFRQAGLNVSFDGGRSWGAVSVLAPGSFGSDPVLDSDGDGAVDALDNCVALPNRDRDDGDENGAGDACDLFGDGLESGDSSRWSQVVTRVVNLAGTGIVSLPG